jgi:hypothetical protein
LTGTVNQTKLLISDKKCKQAVLADSLKWLSGLQDEILSGGTVFSAEQGQGVAGGRGGGGSRQEIKGAFTDFSYK